MNIQWYLKPFEVLTPKEVYQIAQLRISVFIVEQNCNYEDLDDKDLKAFHLFAIDLENDQLIACTRLLSKGVSYKEYASIGRVIVKADYRKYGLGKTLMQKSIDSLYENLGEQSIKISAQKHLENFYNSLGFIKCSEPYIEDGIPHIAMLLSKV